MRIERFIILLICVLEWCVTHWQWILAPPTVLLVMYICMVIYDRRDAE